MIKEFVLALDIGTSSVRAALFDHGGRRIEGTLVQRGYPLTTGAEGQATLDPRELLAKARVCFQGAMRAAPNSSQLMAVGVTCYWHSLLGVDTGGEPLTPIYTWADSRCRPDAALLREEIDERLIHAETGCMLRASFWPAKLRWLRRTETKLFKRVSFWMSPAEWVQWKLTGQRQCALGMATGTGLFNPSTLSWSPRLLEAAGIRENQLSPVSDEAMSWKNTPLFPAVGDGAASNLGSQCQGPDWGAINVGTSAAMRVIRSGQKVRTPFGLFGYRIDALRYLVGGAASNAGNLRAWCLRELRLTASGEALEVALTNRPSSKLTVLPYWTAERAPRWNEDSTGLIAGITQDTTALDLLAAITDASYLRLAEIADAIPSAQPIRWLVSGGILNSDRALKRLASALNSPLYRNPEPEASLRGAAVLALEKLGCSPERLRPGRPVQPNKADAESFKAQRVRALQFKGL